ncbi:MAG: hypothetical protein ACJAVR_002119 [Paracoccaceae bacterium]|jgi:hypothetical protein
MKRAFAAFVLALICAIAPGIIRAQDIPHPNTLGPNTLGPNTLGPNTLAPNTWTRPPAAEGFSYPECYCTNRGVRVELGQTSCLSVGSRTFTARCAMSLNNPTWREEKNGCDPGPSVRLRQGNGSLRRGNGSLRQGDGDKPG